MKIRTCFVSFNYLLAALSLSCLVLSDIFSGPANFFLLASLGLCCLLEAKKIIPLSPPAQFSLWKLCFLFFLLFYFFLDWQLLDLLVAFLVLILFTRLVFKTELNDYLYGYMIAIVCLLVGAVYIQDLVFGFLFLSFYLILCWALILYNLMVERAGSGSPPDKFKHIGENEKVGASLFGLSAGLILVSLVLTAVIFISFPRIGLGFISLGTDSSPISGFSEHVTLGDVGKIKMNPEVVMRVEFTKDGEKIRPRSKVLWRGVALDHYDGMTWSATTAVDWGRKNQPGAGGVGLFPPTPLSEIIQQEVYMEAFDSDIVFLHGVPVNIQGTFRALKMDQSFVLRTKYPRIGPQKYLMVSDISHPDTGFTQVSHSPQAEGFLDRFLQLPELSPQLVQLAASLNQPADSPREKANNILDYLDTGFGYSLEMVKETDKSSLDEFLFQRKKGHCEYFASAMVILLRQGGVPARLVNGFVGQEWNQWGGYMVVRQQHAHSWVEAFIAGKGWIIYDPTPPDPSALTMLNTPLSLFLDLMRLNWQRYVIRYSLNDQIRLVKFFRSRGKTMAHKFKSLKSVEWKDIVNSLRKHPYVPFLAAGLFVLYYLSQTGRWSFGSSRRPRRTFAVTLYRRMLRRLEKRGVHKRPGWTHLEFLQHLAPLPAEKQRVVEKITAFYEKCRFGNFASAAAERKKIQRLIHQL